MHVVSVAGGFAIVFKTNVEAKSIAERILGMVEAEPDAEHPRVYLHYEDEALSVDRAKKLIEAVAATGQAIASSEELIDE